MINTQRQNNRLSAISSALNGAWQLPHRTVLEGVKFQSLYGEDPRRLSDMALVWFLPAASIGW